MGGCMEMCIYLDNNATTTPLPEVIEVMNRAWSKGGNPSSPHGLGRQCRQLLESARAAVEDRLDADPDSLIFTAGATEANNLVLKGVLLPKLFEGRRPRLITTVVEHSSIQKTADWLERLGVEVVRLDVDSQGQVTGLEEALPADLVSIQWVNSETGIVQPIATLAESCRARGVPFHTDAAQAIGKIPVSLDRLPIDFLSFTAHKFHGPAGIGVLYVRRRDRLTPILHGGDQEFGLRPGTENLAGILGLARALEIRYQDFDAIVSRLSQLRNRLETGLRDRLSIRIIGETAPRVGNVANILFPKADGQALVAKLSQHGVYCSQTSACVASRPEPSYVLKAMGLSEEDAWRCIRFSVSVLNREEEIDRAVQIITDCYRQLV